MMRLGQARTLPPEEADILVQGSPVGLGEGSQVEQGAAPVVLLQHQLAPPLQESQAMSHVATPPTPS